jgi:hypothetical protein
VAMQVAPRGDERLELGRGEPGEELFEEHPGIIGAYRR